MEVKEEEECVVYSLRSSQRADDSTARVGKGEEGYRTWVLAREPT